MSHDQVAELLRLAAEAEREMQGYRLQADAARKSLRTWSAHEKRAKDRADALRRAASVLGGEP